MIDLSDCTFIIPLKIDSPERERNIELVLSYLTSHFITTVVVLEADLVPKMSEKIKKYESLGVHYDFIELKPEEPFHRTKYLNMMLAGVRSPVVINYDADIILPIESYIQARDMIINDLYDLVYPFIKDEESQININISNMLPINDIIENGFSNFGEFKINKCATGYGCCQFFKTESYRNGFMENESFISWGPEDYERFYRFDKLGYKIGRCGTAVVHFDHPRQNKDGRLNPYLKSNIFLYDSLKLLNKNDLETWFIKRDWLHKAMLHNGLDNFTNSWSKRISFKKDPFTKKISERQIFLDNKWMEYIEEMFEYGEKNNDDV